MSDIVERLRALNNITGRVAAVEIERLRGEVNRGDAAIGAVRLALNKEIQRLRGEVDRLTQRAINFEVRSLTLRSRIDAVVKLAVAYLNSPYDPLDPNPFIPPSEVMEVAGYTRCERCGGRGEVDAQMAQRSRINCDCNSPFDNGIPGWQEVRDE